MKKLFLLIVSVCFIISGCNSTSSQATDGIQGSSVPITSSPEGTVSDVINPEEIESNISLLPQPYQNIVRDYKAIIELRRSIGEEAFLDSSDTLELSQELKDAIKNNSKFNATTDNEIFETASFMFIPAPNSNTDRNFGYVVKDINADGVGELIFTTDELSIISIVTMHNGTPYLVDIFYKRYRCLLTTDNKLHTITTGGSSTVNHGICSMSSNGELILEFFYGKDFKDNEATVSCFKYDNNDQIWITEEEFNEINAQQQAKIAEIENVVYIV